MFFFVFLTNNDNVETLTRVKFYIKKNQPTRNLYIVAVVKQGKDLAKNLQSDIQVLNRAYPDIKVQFIEEEGKFGLEKIKELSKHWGILFNFMFIGIPEKDFPHKI